MAMARLAPYPGTLKNPDLRRFLLALGGLATLLASACTSIEVVPLPPGLTTIAIVKNDSVIVEDFVPVLERALAKRGITTELVSNEPANTSKASASYVARRSWDLVPYLSEAEVWFRQNGRQIGYVRFYLKGKGGLALTKFDGVENKMTPAYDQLLVHYPLK